MDASNGNDNYDGLSPSAAWKTIAKVNNSSFDPGDQILLKRGETWREQLVVPSSGSAASPITFGAYESGNNPIIKGSDIPTSGDDALQILIRNKSYVTIQDLDVRNAWLDGIHIDALWNMDVTDIVIRRCTVSLAGSHGIAVSNWANTDSDHPIKNILIDSNTVYQNRKHGIVMGRLVANSTISRNTVYENASNSPAGYHGISTWGPNSICRPMNIIIEYNEVYRTFLRENEGTGIQLDNHTESSIVRYNISHDNEGAGFVSNETKSCEFYYNISYRNGTAGTQGGLAAWDSTDLKIYNNIFYDNKPNGMYFAGNSSDVLVKNNILSGNNVYEIVLYGPVTRNYDGDYNLVYHSAGGKFMNWDGSVCGWADWKLISSQDSNSINSNPFFTDAGNDDFTLQAGSPARDAGIDLGTSYDHALWKTSSWPAAVVTKDQDNFGSGWEIGAYIYGGDVEGPNPPTGLVIM
ncbi:MAG: right-handed parallel beta-helix repeat-containing protein [Candidatus Hodarchaeota archaeon]